jgi:hypothetical protein
VTTLLVCRLLCASTSHPVNPELGTDRAGKGMYQGGKATASTGDGLEPLRLPCAQVPRKRGDLREAPRREPGSTAGPRPSRVPPDRPPARPAAPRAGPHPASRRSRPVPATSGPLRRRPARPAATGYTDFVLTGGAAFPGGSAGRGPCRGLRRGDEPDGGAVLCRDRAGTGAHDSRRWTARARRSLAAAARRGRRRSISPAGGGIVADLQRRWDHGDRTPSGDAGDSGQSRCRHPGGSVPGSCGATEHQIRFALGTAARGPGRRSGPSRAGL